MGGEPLGLPPFLEDAREAFGRALDFAVLAVLDDWNARGGRPTPDTRRRDRVRAPLLSTYCSSQFSSVDSREYDSRSVSAGSAPTSVQSLWNHHRRGSTPSARSPSRLASRSARGVPTSAERRAATRRPPRATETGSASRTDRRRSPRDAELVDEPRGDRHGRRVAVRVGRRHEHPATGPAAGPSRTAGARPRAARG